MLVKQAGLDWFVIGILFMSVGMNSLFFTCFQAFIVAFSVVEANFMVNFKHHYIRSRHKTAQNSSGLLTLSLKQCSRSWTGATATYRKARLQLVHSGMSVAAPGNVGADDEAGRQVWEDPWLHTIPPDSSLFISFQYVYTSSRKLYQ